MYSSGIYPLKNVEKLESIQKSDWKACVKMHVNLFILFKRILRAQLIAFYQHRKKTSGRKRHFNLANKDIRKSKSWELKLGNLDDK